jgi:hypothetical protein
MADLQPWLMLSYKIPAEPARHRMAVWRKLKALGAVYLNNGVCVLPTSAARVRQIRVLANEITEAMGGDAVVLEAAALDPGQHERVVERFRADRDEAYREFIERCDGFRAEIERETAAGKLTYAELEENDEDLKKLRAWHAKIAALDYYGASLAKEAHEHLLDCERLLEVFGEQVFEAQLENKPSPVREERRKS